MKNVISFIKKYSVSVILPIAVLIIWQVVALAVGNRALVPTVGAVVNRLLHPFADLLSIGNYLYHISASFIRVIMGFSFAVLVGIPLGLLAGRIFLLNRMINPVIEFLRPICPIAWIPFTMVIFKTYTVADLFGVHYTRSIFGDIQIGMLMIIFYGGFFPVFVNTVYGVTSVRNIYIESAQLLGCDKRRLFRKVILPSALPSILTGLRIGLGTAWMVIVAAEMLPGSEAGLGYLIMYSYELADMDIMMTSIILIGTIGALLSHGVKVIEDRTSTWQAKER